MVIKNPDNLKKYLVTNPSLSGAHPYFVYTEEENNIMASNTNWKVRFIVQWEHHRRQLMIIFYK